MNVRLAAQTLSSSVANAIEFLDKSSKLPSFCNSHGTVKFIHTIDRLFDILNSRNPIAKGFKTPFRQKKQGHVGRNPDVNSKLSTVIENKYT